jgi:hypothetical protein
MQKFLRNQPHNLLMLWQRMAFTSKTWLLASVTLVLLTGLVNPASATGFYKDFVVLNGTYYYTNNNPGYGVKEFGGQNIGTFDRGNGVLTLGTEANTFSDNGDDVQAPQMYYRVYKVGAVNKGSFTPLNTTFAGSGADGKPTNQKWTNTSTLPNLIASTNDQGDYVLETYFRVFTTYNNNGYTGSNIFNDRTATNPYSVTFTVTGTPPAQWDGSASSDWFTPDNWTPAKVPDTQTDVTIPYVAGGVNPVIAYGTAQARTLTVIGGGTANPGVITLSQTGGELQVFGDFVNANSSFQQTGGVFTLAGTTQTFDGGTFYEVHIQGGGRKTLRNKMVVFTKLAFGSGGGIVITRTDDITTYNIDLSTTGIIEGETESNYVLGILRSNKVFNQNLTSSSFGGIGIDLSITSGAPGNIPVVRVTGPDGFSYQGAGTSHSIRRGFIFQPDAPENLTYNLVFHYLEAELSNIQKENLRLFRSPNGNTPFSPLGVTSANPSPGINTVTRTNLTGSLAATFTLGDITNPLPVTLVSFTAVPTAQGTASLQWRTASELDNKGFGIERQLGANDTWQSVGYVAASGLLTGSTYAFVDKSLATAPATATAYYRLRQEDHDGTLSYSPVATLARTAVAGASELTLSPVPVTSSLSVAFAEASQAGLEVAIMNTQGQQLLHLTTQASTDAALSLPVESLAAGVYILTVQIPGQSVRHARFVKL